MAGFQEVGLEALRAADERILASCNIVYVTKNSNNDWVASNPGALTGTEPNDLNSLQGAGALGASGGEGFYVNLGGDGDTAAGHAATRWVKADTIAGNNQLMQFLKGATDITQNNAAAQTKLLESVKLLIRALQG